MDKLKILILIAKRYTFKNNTLISPTQSSFFGIIGITLSISILIIVMSVINGFHKELIKTIISFNSHLNVIQNKPFVPDLQKINQIKKLNFIHELYYSISGMGMAINKNYSNPVLIKGLEYKEFLNSKNFKNKILYQQNEQKEDVIPCSIIGMQLADMLNLSLNQSFTLIVPRGTYTLFGFAPKYQKFKLCGVLNTGSTQIDSSYIVIDIEKMRHLYNFPKNSIESIEIISDNPEKIDYFKYIIKQNILTDNKFSFITWKNQNQDLMNALNVESTVMKLIMSLLVIMSSFMIMNLMRNLIKEKTKEIAILLSMGYLKKDIMIIFLISGLIITLTGIFSGLLIGTNIALNIDKIRLFLEKIFSIQLLNNNIYFLSYLPSEINYADIKMITLFTFIVSLCGIMLPLKLIKKIEPAEILKSY